MVESTTIAKPDSSSEYENEIFLEFKEQAKQTLVKVSQDFKAEDAEFTFTESQETFYLENAQLLRFLMARDFKMAPTLKMYEQWVRWRLTYKADQIRPIQIKQLLLLETMVLGGLTKRNQLTLFIRPRFHQPGVHSIDDLVRTGIFIIEQAIKKIEAEGLDPHIACVYDRTGMTNQNKDGQIVKYSMRMATLMQDFYCERLGDFYVIGANTAFWIGHKLIKPFLAKKTREKIKLIYKKEDLLQYFENDQIYEENGGTKKFSYDPYEMWGLPREGGEEKDEAKGGIGAEKASEQILDLEKMISQQYQQQAFMVGDGEQMMDLNVDGIDQMDNIS